MQLRCTQVPKGYAIILVTFLEIMSLTKLGEGGKFPLGKTVTTRGALAALTFDEIMLALHRHAVGDWGDLGDGDIALNDKALVSGDRLLSRYHSIAGVKFYIITESDRSVTTVLLTDEY